MEIDWGILYRKSENRMNHTHSRICLWVEIFLTSCRHKATIESSMQLLVEFGVSLLELLPDKWLLISRCSNIRAICGENQILIHD